MRKLNRSSSWLVLLSVLLAGCAAERPQVLDLGEFAPYVADFELEAQQNGMALKITDLRVAFGTMDNHRQRAICDLSPDSTPIILVDHDAWMVLDESERESLLFHELGHCVLKRKHRDARDHAGFPESLMYPALVRGAAYEHSRSRYMAELFSVTNEF